MEQLGVVDNLMTALPYSGDLGGSTKEVLDDRVEKIDSLLVHNPLCIHRHWAHGSCDFTSASALQPEVVQPEASSPFEQMDYAVSSMKREEVILSSGVTDTYHAYMPVVLGTPRWYAEK